MGGRGTIKFAVNFPELFGAAAVLSAVPVDFNELRRVTPNTRSSVTNPRMVQTIDNAGGFEAYKNSEENVWALLDNTRSSVRLPRLMFACGHEDALLYNQYGIFQQHCKEIGLDVHWFDLPGYRHEWRFWDLAIQEALTFFGLGKQTAATRSKGTLPCLFQYDAVQKYSYIHSGASVPIRYGGPALFIAHSVQDPCLLVSHTLICQVTDRRMDLAVCLKNPATCCA